LPAEPQLRARLRSDGEAGVASNRLRAKILQRYWRLTRSLTLGAQAVVIDGQDRILLVKHTYRPGWHFPGGGVERHETVEAALARELDEEAGVTLLGRAELFGIYANFRVFPSDHVALFIVRHWQQPAEPMANREIAAHGFFARNELPRDIVKSAAQRLREVFDGAPRSIVW
jgi:ADP-ribose pyrophosphatase YjhB (NUDIX family)